MTSHLISYLFSDGFSSLSKQLPFRVKQIIKHGTCCGSLTVFFQVFNVSFPLPKKKFGGFQLLLLVSDFDLKCKTKELKTVGRHHNASISNIQSMDLPLAQPTLQSFCNSIFTQLRGFFSFFPGKELIISCLELQVRSEIRLPVRPQHQIIFFCASQFEPGSQLSSLHLPIKCLRTPMAYWSLLVPFFCLLQQERMDCFGLGAAFSSRCNTVFSLCLFFSFSFSFLRCFSFNRSPFGHPLRHCPCNGSRYSAV